MVSPASWPPWMQKGSGLPCKGGALPWSAAGGQAEAPQNPSAVTPPACKIEVHSPTDASANATIAPCIASPSPSVAPSEAPSSACPSPKNTANPPPPSPAPKTAESTPPPEKAAEAPQLSSPPPKKGGGPGKGAGKGSPPPPKKGGTPAGKGKAAVEPLKPNVVPRVPLKKLFWTPICLGNAGERGTVWERIHELGATFDTDELEALFADQPPGGGQASAGGRRPSASPEKARVEKRRLFEEQRRRQLWFMLALLPERDTLTRAVAEMDDEVLQPDKIDLLLSSLPSADEESMVRAAQKNITLGEKEVWDIPEDFMMKLIAVPEYALRIRLWGFLNGFDSTLDRLRAAERELRSALEYLQGSERVEKLLALILYVGNYLNGGTSRGRADGFDLDALTKLAKLKASHHCTLLDFIVGQMEQHCPGTLWQIFGPGQEFERVHLARRHRMAEMEEELSALIGQSDGYLEKMAKCDSEDDRALAERREQLVAKTGHLQKLRASFDGWSKNYSSLCSWFHVDTQKVSMEEFFGIWDNFLTDLQKALHSFEKQHRAQRKPRRVASLPPPRCSLQSHSPSERGCQTPDAGGRAKQQ
mmetsp:Transcript_108931/g.243123  ORF Transcript_108931/g.243123 Transcript_108931/m.243123 type:complete len:589 (-) Transcript_108931:28-1794(-)